MLNSQAQGGLDNNTRRMTTYLFAEVEYSGKLHPKLCSLLRRRMDGRSGATCKREKVHRRQSNHIKGTGVPGKDFPRQGNVCVCVQTLRCVRVTTVTVEKQ